MSLSRWVKILIAMFLMACSLVFGLIHGCSVEERYSNYVANTYFTNVSRRVSVNLDNIGIDNEIELVNSTEKDANLIFTDNPNYIPTSREGSEWTSKIVGKSPIIALCASSSLRSALTKVETYSNYVVHMIDMPALVNAIIDRSDESGAINIKSIGVDTDESIKLVIPTTGSKYRKQVVNALVYCITNGEEVTESNKNLVKERLSTLFTKVVHASDIEEYIKSSKHMVLLPEYYVLDKYTTNNSDTNFDIITRNFIYWEEASSVDLILWADKNAEYKTRAELEGVSNIKSEKNTESDASVINSDYIYDSIDSSETFYVDTHFRNSVLVKTGITQYTIDNYKFIDIQSNLEELLGSKYWDN